MKIIAENITPFLKAYENEIKFGLCVLFLVHVITKVMKKAKSNYPPGPMGLPVVGYLPFLSKNAHLDFMQLGKKYGDVLRLLSNMEIYLHERNASAWQSVTLVFFKLFKEKLILATNQTEFTHGQPPKGLTTEAAFMIVVVTIFIIFAFLGSFSTLIEFLYEDKAERKKLNRLSTSRSFFRCFCFIKNWKNLFRTDPDKRQFECLHGIRVISNLSIISFHIGLFMIYTKRSGDELKSFLLSPINTFLFNAYFGVDAFFVLSGFLNAYSFSKLYDKNDGKVYWWRFYLKRFLRLTPAYMIVLAIYTTLLNYRGSGPIWPEYLTNPVCKENWWRYLLFVNNFQLTTESCMAWCWHLAAEMQVYVVSPIFLLLLLRWQRFGYIFAITTIFLSGLSGFLITKKFNLINCTLVQLEPYIDDIESLLDRIWIYVDILYYKPYTRISSYLTGVVLGYYLHAKHLKVIKNSWVTLCFGWISAGILIWISFFALLHREESLLETAIYNSVKHLFFSVGLAWIIFACLTGQGSFINTFLSWKIFLPFSKLSYCAYLIHLLIMQRDYQATEELEEFSFSPLLLHSFRVYSLTFFFSIPVSLLFEMPIINIYELFMKKLKVGIREQRTENIKKKVL